MRIVGGSFGGRRLNAPPGSGTRPTTDRVREALFNILGPRIVGKSVLDCFAGSGALGLESLSRGASSVVFVEKTRSAAETVKANATSLGLVFGPCMRIVCGDLERSIAQLSNFGPFNLWLVDPPFAMVRDGSAVRMLSLLLRAGLLSPEGLVVIEYPNDQPCPEIKGLECESNRRYGDTFLAFFRLLPQDPSQSQS